MQRGLLAVFGGLLVMMVVWLFLMVLLFNIGSRIAPDQFVLPAPGEAPRAPTDVGWLLATLAVDAIAAASCGLVVAMIAGPRGRSQATVAAIVLVIACLFQVFFDTGVLPRWVPLLRLLIAPTALLSVAGWWLGPRHDAAAEDSSAVNEETPNETPNGAPNEAARPADGSDDDAASR